MLENGLEVATEILTLIGKYLLRWVLESFSHNLTYNETFWKNEEKKIVALRGSSYITQSIYYILYVVILFFKIHKKGSGRCNLLLSYTDELTHKQRSHEVEQDAALS